MLSVFLRLTLGGESCGAPDCTHVFDVFVSFHFLYIYSLCKIQYVILRPELIVDRVESITCSLRDLLSSLAILQYFIIVYLLLMYVLYLLYICVVVSVGLATTSWGA